MRRILILFLAVAAALSFSACGKEQKEPQEDAPQEAAPSDSVLEVTITLNNLYQYFEYREYPSIVREDNEKISSVQVSYGLALRDGYTAAKLPDRKDTMQITFVADGVIKTGSFSVDYDTLRYSGTEYSSTRETVSETLDFWPEGDRTFVWTFGNYSKSNILYLENFQVVSASGKLYLKTK